MPISELSRITKWPKVPACYGWLSLDQRGRWRLKGELIMHAGLNDFIAQHYVADDVGRWMIQNGPQKVFVALEYTPWIVRLEADGRLSLHTGQPAGALTAVHLDEEGNVLLHTAAGIGLLDDRDLPAFLATCHHADGTPASEAAVLEAIAGDSGVFWRELPLQAILRTTVPERFGFQPGTLTVRPPAGGGARRHDSPPQDLRARRIHSRRADSAHGPGTRTRHTDSADQLAR